MNGEMDHQAWIETFQELLRHYLPDLDPTPAVTVGSLVAIIAGLFLVFRGMKSDRSVVCGFALVLGAYMGYQLSQLVGTPGPITSAVGAVALTVVAYKTYRWWLAAGSVIVLFSLAIFFQLGRGDLQRYLPTTDRADNPITDGKISLVSKEEQARNLNPDLEAQYEQIKSKLVEELKDLGPTGWLLPVGAAIIGGLLAFWALRIFSIVWLGFVGAILFMFGASTFVCSHWPEVREFLFTHAHVPFGIAIGLWLLGLILQAKDARIPANKPSPAGKESAKS